MKYSNLLFLFLFISFFFSCASQSEVVYFSAPADPPGIIPEMKTDGFWISRLDAPDDLILTEREIEELNSQIRDKIQWNLDLTLPVIPVSGEYQRNNFRESIEWLKGKKLYFSDGRPVRDTFYNEMAELMEIDVLPETIHPRYGLIVRYTNQRVLPSDELLSDVPRELLFDMMQMSALDPGTPVAVISESSDGNWYFVYGPLTRGWVPVESVGLCPQEIVAEYVSGPRLVVTDRKASLYLNKDRTEYFGFARMGSQFPLLDRNDGTYVTRLPQRDRNGDLVLVTGYLSSEESSDGFLPYNQRIIITQAFKMLNTPYGWGGLFGEQDCSRFVIEVFATVGIILPRNSAWQGDSLHFLAEYEKTPDYAEKQEFVAENAIPGCTIFRMISPGHVAMYLGEVEGIQFIIHETWAYKERLGITERYRMLNRVVVTPMDLGEGTTSGPYWQRIVKIVNVLPSDE